MKGSSSDFAGGRGYGWSRQAYTDTVRVRYLTYSDKGVGAYEANNRYLAFPVHRSLRGVCTSNAMCSTSSRTCRYASGKLRKCL